MIDERAAWHVLIHDDFQEKVLGTGILVAPDKVLTAWHVVEKTNVRALRVRIGNNESERVAETSQHEGDLDLGLVTLERAQPFLRPIRFAQGITEETLRGWTGRRIRIHGHPEEDGSLKETPYTTDGNQISLEVDHETRLVSEFADPEHVPNGYSGGPVLVDTDDATLCIGLVHLGGQTKSYAAYGADRCLDFLREQGIDLEPVTTSSAGRKGGDWPRLEIDLEVTHGALRVRYLHTDVDQRWLRDDDEPWATIRGGEATPDGDVLFRLLFGSDEEAAALTREVDPWARNVAMTCAPIFISTEDDRLAALPWAQTRWRGRPLVELGWSLSVAGSRVTYQTAINNPPEIIRLEAMQPRSASDRRDRLDPPEARLRTVSDVQQLREECEHYPPDILHVIQDTTATGVSALDQTLRTAAEHCIPAVILDLVDGGDGPIARPPGSDGLLLMIRRGPGQALGLAYHRWLGLLVSQYGTDLIGAFQHAEFHDPTVRTAVFGSASIRTEKRSHRRARDLARYALDRIDQRAIASHAARALMDDPALRIGMLVGAGAPGNLVDYLPGQVEEELQHQSVNQLHGAAIVARDLRWPDVREDAAAMDAEIQRAFGWESITQPDLQALRQGSRPVIHLLKPPPVTVAETGSVRLLAERLVRLAAAARNWPREVRALVIIAAHCDAGDAQQSKRFASRLSLDPSQIMARALGDLDHVHLEELVPFLRRDTTLSNGLVDVFARRILSKTGGAFHHTVAWVEYGIRTDWTDFEQVISVPDDWPPYYHRALREDERRSPPRGTSERQT